MRLSPVRQRLSPKALCRRKAEAAAQLRTAGRNPEKRKKGQKNSDDEARTPPKCLELHNNDKKRPTTRPADKPKKGLVPKMWFDPSKSFD